MSFRLSHNYIQTAASEGHTEYYKRLCFRGFMFCCFHSHCNPGYMNEESEWEGMQYSGSYKLKCFDVLSKAYSLTHYSFPTLSLTTAFLGLCVSYKPPSRSELWERCYQVKTSHNQPKCHAWNWCVPERLFPCQASTRCCTNCSQVITRMDSGSMPYLLISSLLKSEPPFSTHFISN